MIILMFLIGLLILGSPAAAFWIAMYCWRDYSIKKDELKNR